MVVLRKGERGSKISLCADGAHGLAAAEPAAGTRSRHHLSETHGGVPDARRCRSSNYNGLAAIGCANDAHVRHLGSARCSSPGPPGGFLEAAERRSPEDPPPGGKSRRGGLFLNRPHNCPRNSWAVWKFFGSCCVTGLALLTRPECY